MFLEYQQLQKWGATKLCLMQLWKIPLCEKGYIPLKKFRNLHPTLDNDASKDTPIYLVRLQTNDTYSNVLSLSEPQTWTFIYLNVFTGAMTVS